MFHLLFLRLLAYRILRCQPLCLYCTDLLLHLISLYTWCRFGQKQTKMIRRKLKTFLILLFFVYLLFSLFCPSWLFFNDFYCFNFWSIAVTAKVNACRQVANI